MQATIENGVKASGNSAVGKSRKTFVKVLNGVAQTPAKSDAKLEAEKLFSKAEDTRQPSVQAVTVVPVSAPIPSQLYTAEQLAEKLDVSISYVYAQISKDKPQVHALHGKAFLYSSEYLQKLQSTPRRIRSRRVQPIAPVETAIVKATLKAAQTLPPVSTGALTEEEVRQAHTGNTKSLLERMAQMEQQVDLLLEISKRVKEIEEMLGL